MPIDRDPDSIVKVRPILQAFDIGDDVAEFDERLSSYFVETSSFRDIVIDKADLILGAKGSGKSAIFKHLTNPDADIPELNDVDIIPAFNVQGSVIFRRLSASPPISEPAYRFIWFTFIVAMISNHLLSSYDDVLDLGRLAKLIDAADLRVGSPFPARLWDKIETLIHSISERLELEGELEFGIPKLPVKAKGKGRLRPSSAIKESSDDQVDLEEVLFICADHLAVLGRRCWLIFDRLDEAFEHSRELESTVLRGLMRAHLDVASYGSFIRTKLFLRNDIMDRVMRRQGFVNATHLRRLDLQWEKEGIIDLLARRIASNKLVAEVFNVGSDDLKSSLGRLEICHCVLPRNIYKVSLVEWIHRFTTDASHAFNPRNVLTLVRLARQEQLAVYDRDDPELRSVWSLISSRAVARGFRSLSEMRLEDTVYAEFNSIRPVIEALQGKPARFTHKELSNYIKANLGTEGFKTSLETLEYAGIVSVTGRNVITIAQLYRPALDISLGRNSGATVTEKESLRDRVDLAIETLPQGSESVELPDMSLPERRFIHEYVQKEYPGYTTASFSTGKLPELKTLVIEKQRLITEIAKNLPSRTPKSRTPKLRGYNSAHVALLQGLRDDAARVDDYFVGPPLECSLALTLMEIDHLLRKNKARRRIIGVLTDKLHVDDLENVSVWPILGSCHAWIIDPSRELKILSEELQDNITKMINGLCDIAANERRPVVARFSCPIVKSFVMSIEDWYQDINFVDSSGVIMHSPQTVILQP